MISETRGRAGGPVTRFLRMCEANFGGLGDALGCRLGFDLKSKIDVRTESCELLCAWHP